MKEKKGTKAQARLERKQAKREIRRAQKRSRRRLWRTAFLVIGILVGSSLVLSLFAPGIFRSNPASRPVTGTPPGTPVSIQGAAHINRGQPHPSYNTTPPTSGWHYAQPLAPVPWGIHDTQIDDEVQVHNLEHGGIMVQYDCPEGCPELVGQLEAEVNKYSTKVILAPYKGIGNRIALTAWGVIDKFDDFDADRMHNFIRWYIDQGPERVP